MFHRNARGDRASPGLGAREETRRAANPGLSARRIPKGVPLLYSQYTPKVAVMPLSLSRFRRYLQTLAVEDWRILSRLALWKLAHPLFNVYYVFEYDPRGFSSSPKQLPAGMTVRLLRGEEIGAAAPKLTAAGMPMTAVLERMKRGDLIALVLAGEEVAAYGWTTFADASVPEVGATLRLHADEAVQYNTLVMPRWRGSGLADAVTAPTLRYLAEHGCRRTLSTIHALNTRMLKTIARQGKRQIATIVSSPILGIIHVRNLSPASAITLERKKRWWRPVPAK